MTAMSEDRDLISETRSERPWNTYLSQAGELYEAEHERDHGDRMMRRGKLIETERTYFGAHEDMDHSIVFYASGEAPTTVVRTTTYEGLPL